MKLYKSGSRKWQQKLVSPAMVICCSVRCVLILVFLCWISTVDTLDYNNAVFAGRKIDQLIHALEDVQEYHQVEQSMQVKFTFQCATHPMFEIRIVY